MNLINTYKQFRLQKYSLEETEKQLDIASEYMEKKLRCLEESQAAFREKQLKSIDDDFSLNTHSISQGLQHTMDRIKERMSNVSIRYLDDFASELSRETSNMSRSEEHTSELQSQPWSK